MEKMRYMISDAANLVDVESHVLRYWEDELDLNIPRNEMGHRYYTKENIQEFQKIKELKEQGYQLKAIRMIVHNGILDTKEAEDSTEIMQSALQYTGRKEAVLQSDMRETHPDKMEQFEKLMSSIVKKAIAENNEELSRAIGEEVSEQVMKEMNYLAREQEEAQETRFRQLDDAIRGNFRKKEKKLPRFRLRTEPKTT